MQFRKNASTVFFSFKSWSKFFINDFRCNSDQIQMHIGSGAKKAGQLENVCLLLRCFFFGHFVPGNAKNF